MFALRLRLPALLPAVRYSSTATPPVVVAPVGPVSENTAIVERPLGSVVQAGVINGMPGESLECKVRGAP